MIKLHKIGKYLEVTGQFEEHDDLLTKEQAKNLLDTLEDLKYDIQKFIEE